MKAVSEKWIIGLIAAVQFINILDFMMVMPLGPDFSHSLGISSSNLGIIGGSYTLSACFSGILGSLFLDRFDRKKVLLMALFGLSLATIAGGVSFNFYSLVFARVLAGAFGGPATSTALSIIADTIPPERRGRAMGTVMMSFSLASIFGVPAGLELARLGGWHTPFFAVGTLGFIVTFMIYTKLPPMKDHLQKALRKTHLSNLLTDFQRPVFSTSFIMMFIAMFGAFILIPNFSAYFQYNLGFPREKLGLLYMGGGLASLLTMRFAGKMVDKYSNVLVCSVATVLLLFILYFGYYLKPPILPSAVIFIGFMLGMSTRNVSIQSLTSLVPKPEERAGFNSLQSAVQHLASAAGAFLSTEILATDASENLMHFDKIVVVSMVCSLFIPFMVGTIEPKVRT